MNYAEVTELTTSLEDACVRIQQYLEYGSASSELMYRLATVAASETMLTKYIAVQQNLRAEAEDLLKVQATGGYILRLVSQHPIMVLHTMDQANEITAPFRHP